MPEVTFSLSNKNSYRAWLLSATVCGVEYILRGYSRKPTPAQLRNDKSIFLDGMSAQRRVERMEAANA